MVLNCNKEFKGGLSFLDGGSTYFSLLRLYHLNSLFDDIKRKLGGLCLLHSTPAYMCVPDRKNLRHHKSIISCYFSGKVHHTLTCGCKKSCTFFAGHFNISPLLFLKTGQPLRFCNAYISVPWNVINLTPLLIVLEQLKS